MLPVSKGPCACCGSGGRMTFAAGAVVKYLFSIMPLIVLEGLDGAGKSTQTELLRKLLADRGAVCEYVHFPRFDAPVYGELIARFLRGELGAIDAVDPYIVALLFAGDRAGAADTIRGWLAAGRYVLLDRYVYSNIAYQCAKLEDGTQRERLKRWILDLEYVYHGIPRPDVSVFLDVPFRFTERSLTAHRSGSDRAYLAGGNDIHEASLVFQRRVREMYLDAAAGDDSFAVVDCADERGGMCSPERVFGRIREKIKDVL